MSGPLRASTAPSPRRQRGFATLLVIVYGIFAISATARASVQIIERFGTAPVAYALSLVAALTYIAATVLLARRGGDSRAALWLCSAELLGVLAVGVLTVLDPALFPDATVWSRFGAGYGYVPLVLPVVAIAYLLRRRRAARPAATPAAGDRL
ncbi:hypothetical protein [Brachybacterium nesterenkovii]|uniref:Membrane protein n=1 Tax=Brachybacterium nesterenkovii TaxID=47847 RepID=A0A1X6WTI9_9MICO|nr:hypothetical protein [Brachybacterium nesterenkovii]SLM88249.1 membrane protein [Brachybacterium nesterenkovii]